MTDTTTPSAATPGASGERPWTPGPLSVRRSPNFSLQGNVHIVHDRHNFPVAFVPAWDAPGPGEIDGTDEAKGNARLISAAPDLFAALDEIMDYSGGAASALDDPYVLDRARAALARATEQGADDAGR